MKISLSTARRLALHSQGLDGRWKLPKGKAGAVRTIERLGYVQIDTISVVQRAHEHTFWCRQPKYTPSMLHDLQAMDRRVFEYWTHAASYVPMGDYRYYIPRMKASAQGERAKKWMAQNGRLTKAVLTRIREEGPLGSADFSDPEGRRGPWWGWKPAKGALEMLFNAGELMISERRSFQRIYDLTERVLPSGTDTAEPGEDELGRFIVRRALGQYGFAPINEIWWWRRNTKIVSRALAELNATGEVIPVEVEGQNGETAYALAEVVKAISGRRRTKARVHILSPFDSLVIRRRLKALFDFDYTLECYLPAPKRRYGYFCLPVLWGERFVGRLDAKADRKAKTLIVRKLMFEPDVRNDDALFPALAEKLRAFAEFNNCEQVAVERTQPANMKTPLVRELKKCDADQQREKPCPFTK